MLFRSPTLLTGGVANDGLICVRAWLNRFEDIPGTAFMELQGRILSGTALRDMPAELLRRLLEEPEPMPAMHDWFQVHAALERGELEQAKAAFQALCARVEGYEEPQIMEGLLTLCRADLAFASALESGRSEAATELSALNLKAPFFWYAPHLPPRVRALAAALRGEVSLARTHLADAQRYADNSPYATTVASEAQLRQRIEAIIERNAAIDTALPQVA